MSNRIDWVAIEAHPRFQELHRRKSRFLWGLMAFSVVYYFLLPIGAAYWTELFRKRRSGGPSTSACCSRSRNSSSPGSWRSSIRGTPAAISMRSPPTSAGRRRQIRHDARVALFPRAPRLRCSRTVTTPSRCSPAARCRSGSAGLALERLRRDHRVDHVCDLARREARADALSSSTPPADR